jgi:septum formation protein
MRLTRPLCLASASPRRADLLRQYGLSFVAFVSQVEESPLEMETPKQMVARLAEAKARATQPHFPGHLVLAGDTTVSLDGEAFGKPASHAEAAHMLARLSGRTHTVWSGYCLADGSSGRTITRAIETLVTFRSLPATWIAWYSAQPEAQDKAGAYGIQGIGGAMIRRIEGSYACVMGLPIEDIVWDLLDQGWLTL